MRSFETLALRSSIAVFAVALGACHTPTPPRAPDGVFDRFAGCERIELFALYPYFWNPIEDDVETLALFDREGLEVDAEMRQMIEFEAAGGRPPPFHGWPVLGRATLVGEDRCNDLLALVEDGIDAFARKRAEDGLSVAALCFNPRHGLSLERDGRTYEFVICYQCIAMKVYEDGEQIDWIQTTNEPAKAVTSIFESCGLTIHRDD